MSHKYVCFVSLLAVLLMIAAGCSAASPSGSGQVAQAPPVGFTPAAVCEVPDVAGLNEVAAQSMIAGLGLQPVRSMLHDVTVADGAVISQDPPAGTRLEPCSGDVKIVISLGPMPGPSATPEPTSTPVPTSTPEPTPTSTPIPSPTPDPRLFWDDFESGIRPEWGSVGKGFGSVNGELVLQDGTFESQLIGDGSWTDYRIFFDTFRYGGGYTSLQLRVQDSENYMLFESTQEGCGHAWNWYRVVGGERQLIPGTAIGTRFCQGPNDWITEVQLQGNVYRTFKDGKEVLRFVDDTYSDGGVRLRLNGNLTMQGIEMLEMNE